MRINEDLADLFFRALFCTIFVGLGAEHIFSDSLIRRLMPDWVPFPRLASLGCGIWLVGWGGMILIGWRIRWAALALGFFLVAVTILVHAPGVMVAPPEIAAEYVWLWDILQRSNLVKNVCLLGVCFWLLHHEVGKYSLEKWRPRFVRNGAAP